LATTPSKALGADGFDELGRRNIERLGIANRITQFRYELAAEHVAAFFKREMAHICPGKDQQVEGIEQDAVGSADVVLELIE
jgi:hypothetical protein